MQERREGPSDPAVGSGSKPPQATTVKSRRGEIVERAGRDRHGSEDERKQPLMTRVGSEMVMSKPGDMPNLGQLWAWPDFGPDGIRHGGGVTLNPALARNVGTCRPDAKGAIQAGGPRAGRSSSASCR